MGNGQSSQTTYHPSAVGYSPGALEPEGGRFATTSTPLQKQHGHAPSQGRTSLAGPMRSRARDGPKSPSSKRIASAGQAWQQQLETEPHQQPSPRDEFVQPRTEFSFENLDRIGTDRRSSQPAYVHDASPMYLHHQDRDQRQAETASPSSSSAISSLRREHRISAEPRHASIAEVPEAESGDSALIRGKTSHDTLRAVAEAPEANGHADGILSLDVSDHGHSPEVLPEPLALALKTGLGKHYLEQGMTPADAAAAVSAAYADTGSRSPQPESTEEMDDNCSVAVTHVSRTTNDSRATYRELLPAYWRMEESRRASRGSHGSSQGHSLGLGLGLGQSQGQPSREQSPTPRESRRHSWASSTAAVAAEPISSSTEEVAAAPVARTSPEDKGKGKWTSYWEDRRGLDNSEESVEDRNEVYATPRGNISNDESRFFWDDSDEPDVSGPEATQASSSSKHGPEPASPRTVRRKPVPSLRHSFDEQRAVSTPTAPRLRVSQASTLMPSDGFNSKRSSHMSGGSNTTEALINHVERLRAGPTYQIDPSASSLLSSQSQTPSASAEIADAGPSSSEPSVVLAGKRPRAMSLLALIKGRVRKNSDATSTLSPSPSKTDFSAATSPATPARDILAHSNRGVSPSRGLYGQVRRPSDSVLPVRSSPSPRLLQTSRGVEGVSSNSPIGRPASNSSLRSRSLRSARSSRSRRSASTTSLRAQAAQHATTRKSPSQAISDAQKSPKGSAIPVAAASNWWKPSGGWARRGSSAVGDESGWIDENEEQVSNTDAGSLARRGSEDKKQKKAKKTNHGPWTRNKATAVPTNGSHFEERESPSTSAVAAADTEEAIGASMASFNTSDSTGVGVNDNFSSLARPPHPAPVPPRRPRKQRRANSSSTDESASPTLPTMPGKANVAGESSETMGVKSGRVSLSPFGPLDDEMPSIQGQSYSPLQDGEMPGPEHAGLAAFVPAVSPTSSSPSPRVSDSLDLSRVNSEAGTKEILLSESDVESEAKQTVAEQEVQREADASNQVFWVPGVVRRPRPLPPLSLSPVKELRSQESPTPVILEHQGSGHRRTASQTHSRSSSSGLPTPTSESHRRPLPAPPAIAEPRTDTNAAERATSTSASPAMAAARAQLDGKRSVKSLQKHPGHDDDGTMGNSQAGSMSSQSSSIGRPRFETASGHPLPRPLPPTPQATATRPLRSTSMPSQADAHFASKYAYPAPSSDQRLPSDVALASPTDAGAMSPQESPMVTTPKAAVRESWMSTDGPWSAEVVAANGRSAAPKGLASAQKMATLSGHRTLRRVMAQDLSFVEPNGRPRSSSAPIHPKEAAGQKVPLSTNETPAAQQLESIAGSDPVPFAETAVQASLAALAAMERSSEGTNWRSRWAHERLFGASRLEPPSIRTHGHESSMEPSISELSDLSNSRSRRRAAPYSTRREARKSGESVSSQESRSERHRRRNSKHRRRQREHGHDQEASGLATINNSSSASVVDEGYSSSASDYTSQLRRSDPKRRQQYSWSTAHSSRSQNAHSQRRLEEAQRRQKAWDDLAGVTGRKGDLETPTNSNVPPALKRPPIPSFEVSPPVGQQAEKPSPPKPSASDWDEMVVPALQKRLELEAAEEARFRLSVEGQARASSELLVASPTTPTSPGVPISPTASPARLVSPTALKSQEDSSSVRGKTVDTALSRSEHGHRTRTPHSTRSQRGRLPKDDFQGGDSSLMAVPSVGGESSALRKSSQARSKKSHQSSSKKSRRHHGASSSTSSRLKQGYGRDDIQAWQASLGMALSSGALE
ncbi:hypothetical protein FA10DRAFT_298488 [Acaromyces ingoldii]|uniref:Uncharacterized protein n=1 Tax=Acaromyces ingoldii TaxID=215250 RepID=A0A316YVB4_9BASI|nr:hypothetical protein FA10DRAFT_298488 [Acaromyces ingoldii]PWN93052.1 hypothetical protein FA10DRAFT_298488 [Acaromyces ingoldii]